MARPQRVTVSNWGRWRWTISTVWSRSSMTSSLATLSLLFQGSCQIGEGLLDAEHRVENGGPAPLIPGPPRHRALRPPDRRAPRVERRGREGGGAGAGGRPPAGGRAEAGR